MLSNGRPAAEVLAELDERRPYLGLGTPPPSSAWGLMLEDAQHNFLATDPLLSLWPTLAIAITILCPTTWPWMGESGPRAVVPCRPR
jgi:ABC-type antimicrobial peptide transport system permease subunit